MFACMVSMSARVRLRTLCYPRSGLRLDVLFNPSLVALECGILDRSPVAPKDAGSARLVQIPIAYFRHGHAGTGRVAISGRVFTACHGGELLPRQITSLLGGENAVLPQHESPASTLGVSILNQVGLEPRRLCAHPKTSQFAIPSKEFCHGVNRIPLPRNNAVNWGSMGKQQKANRRASWEATVRDGGPESQGSAGGYRALAGNGIGRRTSQNRVRNAGVGGSNPSCGTR
jgi:hypothetical protein